MNLPEGDMSGDETYLEEESYEESAEAYAGAGNGAPQGAKEIIVFVNGEPVPLTGKDEYIFVDIFDRITFDLNQSRGRAIATLINGRDAQFTEVLSHGDKVDLYWKEN
jgi:hypothetical protein